MRIALVGNPNSGKTSLFNVLCGSNQYVGNWPGVTVEKKSGKLKGHKDIEMVDLPGIYSLSPYTLEEVVSRNFLLENDIDGIINIIDVTNLERNLYLTTQILELDKPVILACNMMDLIEKEGTSLKLEKLKAKFGCDAVEISALKKTGINELIQKIVNKQLSKAKYLVFSEVIEKAISEIEVISGNDSRFVSVKYFEKDQELMKKIDLDKQTKINEIVEVLEKSEDDDCEAIIANERYNFISKIISEVIDKKVNNHELTWSDKIDKIVTNRILAIPIFVLIMYFIYSVAMSGIGLFLTDFANDVIFGEWIPNFISSILVTLNVSDVLSSLILEGIIGGVGAVLGFVPQILVLFFLLAFLEDSGYMARVAFIMDRIFRKFGLSGKSFIPMLVATGCGVPGIMASRTIENVKDRKLTIMLTTFMPCSAKLPIFTLFAGACFGNNPLISTSMYFLAIAMIIICGILLKKTKAFGGDVAPFVMELPSYHMPSLNSMLKHMWSRGESFIKKAGSIILLSSILIWVLSNFNFNFEQVSISESILASFGHLIAPIFSPLGWGDWKASVATITGLIAKENIVMTFGVLYGVESVGESGAEIWSNIASQFTPLMAYSFMAFNLLCAPCFAAIGAIKRELGTWSATLQTVAFQCLVAYVVALLIFQIGSLFL